MNITVAPAGIPDAAVHRLAYRLITFNEARDLVGFTVDEMNAMRNVVRGGPVENVLQLLGGLAPAESSIARNIWPVAGIAGGAAVGGGTGAVVVPVLGQIARKGAQRATRRNVEELQRLVAAGAHPRYIVSRYAALAGPHATPQELSQYLVTTPQADLMNLAAKLNTLKGPQRKLASDALALTFTGNASQAAPAIQVP